MNNLSTYVDEWLDDIYLHQARWEVLLASGVRVFQDDDRYLAKPASAWERLGIHCKENDDYIVDMSIKFRSNTVHVGSNADGFFFCKSTLGSIGASWNFYLCGMLRGDILKVRKWSVPSLVATPFLDNDSLEEIRDPKEAGICLIKRNTIR